MRALVREPLERLVVGPERALFDVADRERAQVNAAEVDGEPEVFGDPAALLGAAPRERAVKFAVELEQRSEAFEVNGRFYSAFTWCGPENGGWIAEDFRLSINLGGVHLCPLPVGHIKKGALWPDDETIARLAEGRALDPSASRRPPGAALPSLHEQQPNGGH